MTVRLAACAAVAALGVAAAGCGGSPAATGGQGTETARPDVSAQVAARRLLAQMEPGGCDCTAEARARERLADGRATRRTQPVVLGGE